jgi:amino acid permease
MDPNLKKMQDIVNLMGKISKIEKILSNIQVIFCFILFYLVVFKNIFILKLFIFVTSVIIPIISFTLTLKQKKLMNEILEAEK